MEKLKITPKLVKEAYKSTGLIQMQGEYFPEEGCACALGAIYKHLNKENNVDIEIWYEENNIDDNFIQSFAAGFDGIKFNNGNQEYYQLGRQCFKEVANQIID